MSISAAGHREEAHRGATAAEKPDSTNHSFRGRIDYMELCHSKERKPSRWRLWFGGTLFVLGAAEKIIGWGGSLDFVISRWSDPGWVGTVLRFIASNSYYFSFVLMLAGLGFIIWNERRRTDKLYGPLKEQWENAPDFAAKFNLMVDSLPVLPSSIGDTLAATGTVSDPTDQESLERSLHTCYILVSTDKLKDAEFIELCIVAYNASPNTLSLADVRGNARCTMTEADREITEKLGVPDMIRISPARQIAPFSEFVMTLNQTVSARQSLLIRGTMRKKSVTLDLRELVLEFTTYREPGPMACLKLWDGVGIGGPNPVRFCRIQMMSAGLAI